MILEFHDRINTMNRRQFLATTAGSLAWPIFPRSRFFLWGKIKKAVKFGTSPNEEQMKKQTSGSMASRVRRSKIPGDEAGLCWHGLRYSSL